MGKTVSPRTIGFSISGLNCEGCVATAETALKKEAGVHSAKVELESGRATVEVEPDFDDLAGLDTAIAQAGYKTDLLGKTAQEESEPGIEESQPATDLDKAETEAPPEAKAPALPDPSVPPIVPRVQTQTDAPLLARLRIEGMTCASCVAKVDRALASVKGVERAEVNFGTHVAQVFGEGPAGAGALIGAVAKAGYGAEILRVDEEADPAEAYEAERSRAREELQAWRVHWIGAAIGSLFLLITSQLMALGWVHAAVALGIQIWAGGKFYRGAWRGLKALSANMDTLIALSTTTAWGYGFYLLVTGAHAAHEFMTGTMLLTFVGLGKWLEGRGRLRAGEALKTLLELAPARALKLEGEQTIEVDSRSLAPGDRCRVLQGERIPSDGSLDAHGAEIDESMLTGESMPAAKRKGDTLYGGTVNVGAALTMVIEKVGSATALRQIARRVDEAQNTRPKMQALADRAAAVFVPIVLGVAVVTLLGSLAADLAGGVALTRAIAVLIVACPCALGLATPLAVMAGVGVAARRGIIVRSAATLEVSSKLDRIAFDKTGTLTVGAPEVTALSPSGDHDEHALLDAAASLEADTTHPLGRAILEAARSEGILPRPLEGLEAIIGQGIHSAEPPLALGSLEFLHSKGVRGEDLPPEMLKRQSRGETIIGVGTPGGKLIGTIALADQIKPGAARTIEELRGLGLSATLISGDSEPATRAVASMLGIDDYRARVKPNEKADAIAAMQADGLRVAMVGDGINDAPALAQSDLGIAMASGSDIAQEAAGLVLLGSDPRHVPEAIRLARAIHAKMIQNLGWAFVYNLALIPLAAFGYLQPIYASAAMAASSVSVVGNALLLYRRKN